MMCSIIALTHFKSKAQGPCMNNVPAYTVNLTGFPAGVWSSPNVSRNGQCCGVQANNSCIYFYLILDPNAAGIQIDMIGADPAGSLFYSINCIGSYPGGTIKCINGVGPHQITFCKPGGNSNIYKITSIPKPLFPKDDTLRIGCKHKFTSLGVVNNSVTWNSIFPGTPGQYNNYLDSTNVASPTYSPLAGAPPYIDYKVCGFPLASNCGYSVAVCDTVRVYNFPKLTVTVTPNPATFCNLGPGSGVSLTGMASGGSPAYTFTWKNTMSVTVGTGTNYFATAAGNFYLVVKDILYNALECPAANTVVSVSQGTIPIVDAGPSQKKCASNPIATLNGSVQFAGGGIWSGGAGTYTPGNNFLNTSYSPSPAELTAGFVKLYLTSTGAGGNCGNIKDSTKIYYSSPLNVTIPSASIACYNGTTTINSNVIGGTLPYAYLWNTGSTNPFTNGGQGNYSLYVIDSLGCSGSINQNVYSPPAMNIIFNVTNVTINGGNNGTASVTVSGGNPAYSVTWTPGGANSFSINNLVYGVYTANVKDANGCFISGSTVVNEPRCLGFSAAGSSTNVLCYNASNGVASITVSGGTPAYTYTWNTNPVQNTAVATNLNAGVHSVIAQDGNNCFQTFNVTITEPSMLTNVMTHTNVSIIGGNNGAASANPFGGSVPYSYLWNFGVTTASVGGLFAGTYSVTVSDNNGCTKSDNVLITQPPCNGLTINVYKNNVSCYGGANGSALAIISGANGSYTINWSTGATGPSISNLPAGNYSVMVTNANNCSEFVNFTIIQPSQLSIGLMPTNVSCNGNNNGSIDLIIAGGSYPYTFSWSNGSNSEDLINLSPGNYSVQIIDAAGCSVVGSANITQPLPLNVTYTLQNVTCIYGNNGAIGVNVNGGTFPFTYTWSTGANTQSISGITAGGYSVSIKDANNCTLVQPLIIPITQPDSVKVASFSVACSVPGSNQTQVTIIPTGGNPAYQVSYNNGFTFQPAGVYTAMLNNSTTYSVVLKDVNNCNSLAANILIIPGEVKIDSVNFSRCYSPGTTSTNIVVYPSGGDNGPYTVSYNNGGSYLAYGIYTANLNIAGSYTIIVKDNRGCVSAVHVITLPSVLSATANVTSNYNGQNISCFGLTNGAALANATGGSGAYTYSWTTTPTQTNAAANNLGAGIYSVTIKDIFNCTVTKTVVLTQPIAITSTAIVTSNYNGQNVNCYGASNGSASVTSNGGTVPYTYNWSTVPSQTTASAVNLNAGTYSVIVNDINGCAVTATVSLTQPAAIISTVAVVSNYNGQQISCYGGSNGSATVNAINGTAPFTYTWSTLPAQTGTLANSLSAGNYSVIITDANGCNVTATIALAQPAAITSTALITSNYNGQNISCFGLSDGSASVNPNGGTAPYTYIWTTVPTQTTAAAVNLSAGFYSVTVTDNNGCTISSSVNVTQPPAIIASVASISDYNGFNVACFGSTNGNANISVVGGTGGYTYLWSNAAITQNVSNIGAGNYTVITTDINGCSDTLSILITQPPQLVITIDSLSNYNGYNLRCNSSTDGSIFVSVNGGVASYNYLWSNGNNSQNLTGSASGNYTLTVVDQNNCTALIDTILSKPPNISFTSNITPPLCNGVLNGAIDVTVGGGVNPFSFNWSNGLITEDINGIPSGTYTVLYSDKNGCSDSSKIIVNQPQALALSKKVNGLKCYGDSIAAITLALNGGTSPYTYLWSNGANKNTISNLKKGLYFVKVTDSNGCVFSDTTKMIQPDSLQLALYSPLQYDGHNISYPNGNDGSIDLAVKGGALPYNYIWSNSESNEDVYNLFAGNYNVTVVDNNGCKVSGNIILTEPLILEMPTGFSPNNDGKNDLFMVHGIEAYPRNNLTIYNRWGNIVYEKNGYTNEWNGVSRNGQSMPDATYFVILEINGGEKVLKGFVELRR